MYVIKHGRDFAFPDYEPKYPPSPPYRIESLLLELRVYPDEERIEGNVRHSIIITRKTSNITLNAVDMDISKVLVDGSEGKYLYDGEKLIVYFDDQLDPKTRLKLEVSYSAYPKKGLYFIKPKSRGSKPMIWSQGESEDNRYWIPIYDFPNMKFKVELIIWAPKELTVFANGDLIEVRESGTWRVWHWRLDYPIPSYLIAIAIGEFDIKEEKIGELKLVYAVPKGLIENIERSFSNTSDMIKFFEDLVGVRYPWGKTYKQICVREFIVGGMENASITLLTDRTLHDEKAHKEYESEPLISHELAHQWFGDLVTTKDWGNIWLNESFATYLEALYIQHLKGEDEFIYELIRDLDIYLREYSTRYSRPIATRLYKYPTELFDAHAYPKGALVLRTLHSLIGDEKFREFLRLYLEKHRFGNADTEDLRKVLEEVTGEDFEWFFDQYIYNAGHPVLTVTHTYSRDDKLLKVTIKQTQKEDSWEKYFLPIEIRVKPKNRDFIERRFWMEKKEQTFIIPIDDDPEVVCVDPRFKILAKIDDEEGIEFLINKLKFCGCVYCKIRAIRTLKKHISEKVVRALEELLMKTDEFWGVRYEAALALGEIATKRSKTALIRAEKQVLNPKIRRGIAYALRAFRNDDEVAEVLIKILENEDEGYYVRATAAESLGKIRHSKSLKYLKKHKDTPAHDHIITRGVLKGLAFLRTDEALKIILEYTKPEKPTTVRAEAVSLLGKFNDREEARDAIVDAINDENLRVRSAALAAISETMDPRYIPYLEGLIGREIHDGLIRRAREIRRMIERFMDKGSEYQKLREELEKLREDQRRLYDEFERIEAKIK